MFQAKKRTCLLIITPTMLSTVQEGGTIAVGHSVAHSTPVDILTNIMHKRVAPTTATAMNILLGVLFDPQYWIGEKF